jgi:hypothetical protein
MSRRPLFPAVVLACLSGVAVITLLAVLENYFSAVNRVLRGLSYIGFAVSRPQASEPKLVRT